MTLIKSISGIRGTIGGLRGDSLTPYDIVKFSVGYSLWLKEKFPKRMPTVIVGRDGRVSGPFVSGLVVHTLAGCGVHVVDIGLSTTPSVEMAVKGLNADGGIIVTASHNPENWNALKLLNQEGEFLSAEDGEKVLLLSEQEISTFPEWDKLGSIQQLDGGYYQQHIEAILAYPLIDGQAIEKKGFKVVVDAINSTGGIAVPLLLEKLGTRDIIVLNKEPMGHFAHNPEPLEAHLQEICRVVKEKKADLGIVVDPDVDRLALIQEDGLMFGEENTLVAVAQFFLKKKPGVVVNNLSSSRALKDVANAFGCRCYSAAVGEVNVVQKMKETGAVLGGEGNGGIIVPELHYGRDALAGIGLILSYMATENKTLKQIWESLPQYYMAKKKITLPAGLNADALFKKLSEIYKNYELTTTDGLKIDLPHSWLHIRKSNTEPIVRIYSEAKSLQAAEDLATSCIIKIEKLYENVLSL